ncbi:MAG: N-6 DNA methylase, partial [Chitinophagaceae bacterium]|nr:N-6 DNA methylase [Chitinophagaceae bacterium]
MSSFAITNYYNEVEKIKRFGGSNKETSIRNAFYYLLNEYAKQKDLMLVAEISTKTKQGKLITPDGTLKDYIRNDWGYWESKDESDDINEEIKKKFSKGYPSDNIFFEDSQTAVLYQHGDEVLRVNMREEEELNKILTKFIHYERPEVHDFREAIEKFKQDIPKVTEAIRLIIDEQEKSNKQLHKAQKAFLELCQVSINPAITAIDVIEMMVQHILSADIFNTIFDEPHFHQENNIASELNKVINTFFTGNIRRQTLGGIKHYYDTINARAATIADHHEKQKFLKVVYENFYKGYNPKAADRLGIVYTPNEIVQFMIKSTDYLLHKHFGKSLGDKNVEILDPATGTGTFICDIIDYLPKNKLKHKYQNELHANELAILPYYIANLNIEYTYKQKMGEYEEFGNLCFVDTLDKASQHFIQAGLFGVSAENATRIRRQNESKISVVIGNPPYNANQQNENENNKNREYKEVDRRIKETFIKHSTAQKTKLYDMYSRFYRWAMDRLTDNGIISFITNRSFIDSRTFDGFRKIVSSEFNNIYIIDLGGDVRMNPKLSGSKHNVFGIQTGVAIMFLVRQNNKLFAENKTELKALKKEFNILQEPTIEYNKKTFYASENVRIQYIRRPEMETASDKLSWLSQSKIEELDFERIVPDYNSNWINNTDNDWDELIPVCSKEVKSGKSIEAIFKNTSLGIATNRDEWVYDFSNKSLLEKISFFGSKYNSEVDRWFNSKMNQPINDFVSRQIKWTSELENYLRKNTKISITKTHIRETNFRPFIKRSVYYDKILIHRFYQQQNFYPITGSWDNKTIGVHSISADIPLSCLSSNRVFDLGYLKQGNGGTFCLPLYAYDENSRQIENITDWSLNKFKKHYGIKAITKEDIFHYVYAVLHNPTYRKKYELNLKREFPRVPLYSNFNEWAAWGKQLMDLHINYEEVPKYKLKQVERLIEPKTNIVQDLFTKGKLKANKLEGTIELDGYTTLTGIPKEA